MPKALRGALVLLGAALASSYLLHAGSASKSEPISPKAQSSNVHMAMPLYAPLFIESQNYASTLTMVNELAATVHATVVLRRLDGSTVGQRVVTFSPHSREVLHIKELLDAAGPPDAFGSLEIVPDPMEVQTMAIAAQLSIVGTQQSPPAYLEEEFLAPDPMNMTEYRATAPSARGSALVALLNTTTKPETLSVTCLSNDGASARRDYSLSAFQSVILPACGDTLPVDAAGAIETLAVKDDAGAEHGATGIDVVSDTGMGTFAVWGIASTRFGHSAAAISMNFINSAQMKSASMVFAGVPVGIADLLGSENFTPELTVANFALLPSNVTISYSRMSANNPESKTVASFSLAAGAVREFKVPDLAGDPGMRNSFIVTSDAQPGAVIGNLISRGQELYPVVQLIGKDAQDLNNGGGHPWSIGNGDDSTLLLFNHATNSVFFTVNIAGGGVFWNQQYKLTPNETYALDLKAVVTNQVPDSSGKKLPADVKSGEASWFTPGSGEGTGRLVISNPGVGLARNFSCGYDIVLCGSYMGTSSATFGVGGTGSLAPLVRYTETSARRIVRRLVQGKATAPDVQADRTSGPRIIPQ